MCHRFDILESFFLQPPCSSIILHNAPPSGHNLGGGGKTEQATKDKVNRVAGRLSRLKRRYTDSNGNGFGLSELELLPAPAQPGIRKHLYFGDRRVSLPGHVAGPTRGLNHSTASLAAV